MGATLAIETTWLATTALFMQNQFVEFREISVAALLTAYVCASLIYGLRTTKGSWGNNRRIALVVLIIGAALASGGVHGDILLPLLTWLVVGLCGALVIARATRSLERRGISLSRPQRTIAFIGNSPSAARMVAQIEAEEADSVNLIGFFDDRNSRSGPLTGRVPNLGGVDDVVAYLQEHDLSEVFVALPWSASARMAQLLDQLRFLPLTVRLVPDHVPPSRVGRTSQRISDVIMPTLMVPPFSTMGGLMKRSLDLVVACFLIIPLTPIFLLTATLIRLDSNGPVFFRQARSGQFGRSFMIFKFRTLYAQKSDASAETLVTKGDSRVTRVGRFLRKYSIDELPQILNVLFGDMSLVGPRPHAPRAKANGRTYGEVLADYPLRYRVKPGMTGWAQVNGWRGNTDTEDQLRRRVEYDFDYIGHWSIWRDLKILLKTIPSTLMPPSSNA